LQVASICFDRYTFPTSRKVGLLAPISNRESLPGRNRIARQADCRRNPIAKWNSGVKASPWMLYRDNAITDRDLLAIEKTPALLLLATLFLDPDKG
jgi:hypothetical protein